MDIIGLIRNKEKSMFDIPSYSSFKKIELVNKGWSDDKKYYIETDYDRKLLLRLSEISQYERKKSDFEIMKKVASLNVPMSLPVDFGVCDNNTSVYQLLTWVEGEDAETVLPDLSDIEQYNLGIQSGKALELIHSIPAPSSQEDWETRFTRKMNYKIKKYKECGIRFKGDELVIEHIERNKYLLNNRPQSLQHGDYHIGNMIVLKDQKIHIIDWNRMDYGDPWEEFNRIVWSATVSPHFASGQLHAYFNGNPPDEFFKLLALYISSNTLSSIYWAIPFGQSEIDTMMKQSQDILSWYDNMSSYIPSWYIKTSN